MVPAQDVRSPIVAGQSGLTHQPALTCGYAVVRFAGQAEPGGLVSGGPAIGHAEFPEHGRDVVAGRLGGDEQLGGDIRVGASGADQVEDFLFAARQAEGMLAGGGVPSDGDRADAQLRMVRRMMRAVAVAPRSWQMSRAWRRAGSSAVSSRASAAS